ncbi:hypothetical protein [Neptunicella marina]|uniref:DUF2968 domain-containing protein n=1 Tax=Neptunicella marina TaxID=2125989 RepID=A0A8J6ISI4_9ALTE|nr:hypothetical protein [Neptunicella marina]MBC3764801.1 hypothetical protein [Neptunicella marina]
MKKSILTLLTTAMFATTAGAATQMAELSKDMQIMSSILKTSLQQNNDKAAIRFHNLDMSYLADQGVVFEVSTSKSRWNFNFDFGSLREFFPAAPVAPVAPVPGQKVKEKLAEKNIVITFDTDDFENEMEEAMEHAKDAMRDVRDKLRELRDERRQLSWDEREYERRRRDIEFEKSHADAEDKKELEQEIAELNKQNQELAEKRKKIDEYAAKLEAEQQKSMQASREMAMKNTRAFLAKFEDTVAETLCKYGMGVKSMPEGEHVSFILEGFGEDENDKDLDRVYVFNNKDIKSCVAERMTKDQLLKAAKSYMF